MYKIIAIISLLVRQFVLPNPFECFGDAAWLINLAIEPILHFAAYQTTGMFYSRSSIPAIGSILYLFFYACYIGVLSLLGIFSFAWWWVLIIFAAMIGIYIGLNALADKLSL